MCIRDRPCAGCRSAPWPDGARSRPPCGRLLPRDKAQHVAVPQHSVGGIRRPTAIGGDGKRRRHLRETANARPA
eukprot:10287861-Alexandrium_andersonii.AAC.1